MVEGLHLFILVLQSSGLHFILGFLNIFCQFHDCTETMTGDHLRSTLPATTTTFLCSSKMVEKDFDLVILTSNVLFLCVKSTLHLFRFLALQLDYRTAVEADLLVHVVHLVLLVV